MSWMFPAFGSTILAAMAITAGYFTWPPEIQDRKKTNTPLEETATEPLSYEQAIPLLIPSKPSEEALREITNRPIFSESRRPRRAAIVPVEPARTPEPKQVAKPRVELPEPKVQLLGVLMGGSTSSALISLEGGDPEWVKEGSRLAGWQLEKIFSDSISISSHNRVLTVELYRK